MWFFVCDLPMLHNKTDELNKLFELLYSIDQRLLREALEINNSNPQNYDGEKENTRLSE